MRKTIAIAVGILLLAVPARGQEQIGNRYKYYCEGYVFFGHRSGSPGRSIAGLGGDAFIFKGLAVGADFATTVGNPDTTIRISSVGTIQISSVGLSYHFLRTRPELKVDPFLGAGFSYLHGEINTYGYTFPWDPGNDRVGQNFNQGLIIWPTKHVGIRFELREHRIFVSYGALQNVIPGGDPFEVRIGVTLR